MGVCQKMDEIKVTKQWCDKLAVYLAKRPFGEVYEIILELQKYVSDSVKVPKASDK